MANIDVVIGAVCAGVIVALIVVWVVAYRRCRAELFRCFFGGDGAEVRGIPLRSQAPHLSEEQRRQQRRALRRQQRENNNNNNNNEITLQTPGSNSRWFRKGWDTDSETCGTMASSGVVYGHGDYITGGHASEPAEEISSQPDRRKQRRHRRMSNSSSSNNNNNNNNNRYTHSSPFGGWDDSARSRSSDEETNTHASIRAEVNLDATPPRRPTRWQVIEGVAMSGFFTAPALGWGRNAHAENYTAEDSSSAV